MIGLAAKHAPSHQDPDNPFGLESEAYRFLFRDYDDVAHAMRLAEEAYVDIARHRFRAHATGSRKAVTP